MLSRPFARNLRLFYMLVRKQMILTIFIIAVTFRTKPKLQIRIIQLRAPADGTFVFCDAFWLTYLPPVTLFPVNLLWRNPPVIPG